ncbi:protein of unknown function [Methylocaldum szegediense]|jgi:hypothetical protein|uniref:Uncharacterized protein n=1 Tax=Methylocaldum szegediense TaxID=73780 RepID=A0ABM9I0Z9_9GAMM|nr:protein of unknown function [Methylocaldum szegediense]
MRGVNIPQEELFSDRTLEEQILKDESLQKFRVAIHIPLTTPGSEFDAFYAWTGRNRFCQSSCCAPVSSKSCPPSAPSGSWSSSSAFM